MRVVSDAGPLIHLSWINQLSLLNRLFDQIVVPPAVQVEILAAPTNTQGLDRIQQAITEDAWLVRAPTARLPDNLATVLDMGEAEALVLAGELHADLFLTDDALARTEAKRSGLAVVGTIGILTQARDQGFISAVLPLLLELRSHGQWLSEDLVDLVRQTET